MSKINLFGRLGNKQQDIKHFKHLLPTDISNVVEPFGGSFAVIRKIYNDDKYEKFVNDNDETLYKIYLNPDEYYRIKCEINEILKKHLYDGKNVYSKTASIELETMDFGNKLFKDFVMNEITTRGSMLKYTKSTNCQEHIDLIKKIKFSNVDWEEFTLFHSKDENTFIFLDPPYLFSDNSQYSKQKRKECMDMTDMIFKIADIFKSPETKAKIMLVINDMKIIRWFFNDFNILEYSKIYAVSKRKDTHLVITNYL